MKRRSCTYKEILDELAVTALDMRLHLSNIENSQTNDPDDSSDEASCMK